MLLADGRWDLFRCAEPEFYACDGARVSQLVHYETGGKYVAFVVTPPTGGGGVVAWKLAGMCVASDSAATMDLFGGPAVGLFVTDM